MRLVFTADPGPALVVALSDMRDRFRWWPTWCRTSRRGPAPECPSACGLDARAQLRDRGGVLAGRGRAHHTVMTTAVGIQVWRDFAEIARTELLVIDDSTTVHGLAQELRWNQAYYRLATGI